MRDPGREAGGVADRPVVEPTIEILKEKKPEHKWTSDHTKSRDYGFKMQLFPNIKAPNDVKITNSLKSAFKTHISSAALAHNFNVKPLLAYVRLGLCLSFMIGKSPAVTAHYATSVSS